MSQGSANRRSAYLTALTQEIERKLQRALNCPSQRVDLLQQLLADIALEIDDRARDIMVSRNEDGIAEAEDRMDNCLCFYEVLADHYVRVPEDGKHILDLIVQLWSQSFVSHIFALLFHKWLFEVRIENTEALLRYGSALVQGARNVFWIRTEDEYKHKIEVMPLQLHISWGSYVSNKSCASCSLGYTGFSFPCWTVPAACYQPFLQTALSLVLALILLEFHYDVCQNHHILYLEVDPF